MIINKIFSVHIKKKKKSSFNAPMEGFWKYYGSSVCFNRQDVERRHAFFTVEIIILDVEQLKYIKFSETYFHKQLEKHKIKTLNKNTSQL